MPPLDRKMAGKVSRVFVQSGPARSQGFVRLREVAYPSLYAEAA
jgi:hypothetical protein